MIRLTTVLSALIASACVFLIACTDLERKSSYVRVHNEHIAAAAKACEPFGGIDVITEVVWTVPNRPTEVTVRCKNNVTVTSRNIAQSATRAQEN